MACYLWPSLGSPLPALGYVIYFRFCEWRNVSPYSSRQRRARVRRNFKISYQKQHRSDIRVSYQRLPCRSLFATAGAVAPRVFHSYVCWGRPPTNHIYIADVIGDLRRRAFGHGHGGATTRRLSSTTRLWWRRWWRWWMSSHLSMDVTFVVH